MLLARLHPDFTWRCFAYTNVLCTWPTLISSSEPQPSQIPLDGGWGHAKSSNSLQLVGPGLGINCVIIHNTTSFPLLNDRYLMNLNDDIIIDTHIYIYIIHRILPKTFVIWKPMEPCFCRKPISRSCGTICGWSMHTTRQPRSLGRRASGWEAMESHAQRTASVSKCVTNWIMFLMFFPRLYCFIIVVSCFITWYHFYVIKRCTIMYVHLLCNDRTCAWIRIKSNQYMVLLNTLSLGGFPLGLQILGQILCLVLHLAAVSKPRDSAGCRSAGEGGW